MLQPLFCPASSFCQKFAEPAGRVVGHAGEDVGKPCLLDSARA
jgi:hypothetical protein